MRVVPSLHTYAIYPNFDNRFLTYAQRFDIVPQLNPKLSNSATAKGPYPDPSSGLYILKRAKRANQGLIGDIIPLDQVRTLVELAPRFGGSADRRLTKANSLAYSSEFWLNKYLTKELFYALELAKST